MPPQAGSSGSRWTWGSLVALAALAAPYAIGAAPVLADRPQGQTLLERYRPLLRYDSRERYFAQPVRPPLGAPRVRRGHRVYGHLAREDGETWLQYWLFYAYNPQDRGLLRTGRHAGDWELFQLRVGRDRTPDLATLAQHGWAEGCAWRELERVRLEARGVPVVYVANGSHANYARAGSHDRPFPDPNDEADGEGTRVRPVLTPIEDQRPVWVSWRGRFGKSRAGIVPGEQSSPRGPRFREDDPWSGPASFHREQGRRCGSGPPGRPWQTPAALAMVLMGIGAGVVLRRRLPSRP